MGTAPAFASVGEALDIVRAGLGYLAAADAAQLSTAAQAECLRELEQAARSPPRRGPRCWRGSPPGRAAPMTRSTARCRG